jgi:hypothetical protein
MRLSVFFSLVYSSFDQLRQRPGGSADDQDLKKKSFGGFNFGKKKKAAEPEPEARKTNWWTL